MTAVKKTIQGSTRNKRDRTTRQTKGSRKPTRRSGFQRPTDGPPTGVNSGNGLTIK